MITWTTAMDVEFERVCSTSNSEVSTGYEVAVNYIVAGFYTEESAQSIGYTQNQSVLSSHYSSSAKRSYQPINPGGDSFITIYPSFETNGATSRLSVAKITTTTDTVLQDINITSSSEGEQEIWTTNNYSEFAVTTATASVFFEIETTRQSTRTTLTTIGTTNGNAADTIYQADKSEVLWVINESPVWSAALTDNAISTTRTTVYANYETSALLAAISTSLLPSSVSSGVETHTTSSLSSIANTINHNAGKIGGETQQVYTEVSSSRTTSKQHLYSSQFSFEHYGNTRTKCTTSLAVTSAQKTDVIASVTWQQTAPVYGTTQITEPVNEITVATFSLSDSQTTTSCYGNTTVAGDQFIGGRAVIAGNPSMSVYGPCGVALNGDYGLYFEGNGIPAGFGTQKYEYVFTVIDGTGTGLTTAQPVEFSWATQSLNSITYQKTTVVDGESDATTTLSASFSVAGEHWVQLNRSRKLNRSRIECVGGDLGLSETGLIRIERGLYKNQDGETSFFDGNDTTYTGTRESSYWRPISYLIPAFGQSVFVAPRNTSSWPA